MKRGSVVPCPRGHGTSALYGLRENTYLKIPALRYCWKCKRVYCVTLTEVKTA